MVKENTNKSIAINSIILYAKLFINTITGLLTTRFALQALGINDFGLFSVLGSIISFIGIFNTIMVATSNRFISVAIGKGDLEDANKQFNVCLSIHTLIAFVTLIIVLPIGYYYVYNVLKYEGNLDRAMMVFCFTSIASIITFIGVPFQGLLVAKEKFLVFSLTDVISHIVKLGIAYSLLHYFENKLMVYALTLSILTALPTFVNYFYCRFKYKDIVKFSYVKEKSRYKEILGFSGWVSYGAVACIARSQGSAIIVNSFFNTAMNTALGLANTIGSLLSMFTHSFSQPIMPQITKSYAAGDTKRYNDLLVIATKYTYLVMLIVSLPFLVEIEWILKLWLGEIPNYVIDFSALIIIDMLIQSLNSGVSNIIFASGKIKFYQLSVNTLRLLAIVAAYVVLKMGGPAHTLFYAYIVFSMITFFSVQYILRKTLNFDNSILWRKSYLPTLGITLLMIPFTMFRISAYPIVNIIVVEILLFVIIFWIAFSRHERQYIVDKMRNVIQIK